MPQTNAVEILAQFGDSYDVADFEDELEGVTAPVFERTSENT